MQRLKLQCRYLEEGDIDNVNAWLEGWKKLSLDKGMYPKKGLILYNTEDNQPIYAGFLWTSDECKLAQIGFITRNPYYKIKLPKGLRKDFIAEIGRYAAELGYTHIMTRAENPLLVNDFKALGYAVTSDRCTELIAKIQ